MLIIHNYAHCECTPEKDIEGSNCNKEMFQTLIPSKHVACILFSWGRLSFLVQ